MKKPIPFRSFGGYRLFCESWWVNLTCYTVGAGWTPRYQRDGKWWWQALYIHWPGWCRDIYSYWHRARYGWAPRDTRSLDYYLNKVLGGSILYLADHNHGAPAGYGTGDYANTNFSKWDADLRRWSQAFLEDPEDVDIYDSLAYEKHWAEEKRRRENLHQALREIEPHWDALCD